jgi:hypothetical protein
VASWRRRWSEEHGEHPAPALDGRQGPTARATGHELAGTNVRSPTGTDTRA